MDRGKCGSEEKIESVSAMSSFLNTLITYDVAYLMRFERYYPGFHDLCNAITFDAHYVFGAKKKSIERKIVNLRKYQALLNGQVRKGFCSQNWKRKQNQKHTELFPKRNICTTRSYSFPICEQYEDARANHQSEKCANGSECNLRNGGIPIKAIEQILKYFDKWTKFKQTTKILTINASKGIPTAYRFLGVEFVPLGQTGSEYTFAGK